MSEFQDLYEKGKIQELLELTRSSSTEIGKIWEIDALLLLERHEEASSHLNQHSVAFAQSNNLEVRFKYMHIQGILDTEIGNIDTGRSYLRQAVQFAEMQKLDDFYLCRGWINFGLNYNASGDFTKTFECASKALQFTGMNKFRLTIVNIVLGYASANNNNLKDAMIYFEKGLKYSRKIDNDQMMCHAFHGLINAHSWLGNLEIAKKYLKEFEKMEKGTEDRLIIANYKFSKAIYLFNNPRLATKMKSLELFIQILDEQLLPPSIEVWVYWYVLELLFGEYRLYKENIVIQEIKQYIDRYYARANQYSNIAHITISLITQAQFAGVEGEFIDAEKIISQAITTAKEFGSVKFVERATIFREKLLGEFKQMEELILQNATLSERLNKSSLVEYLKNAQNLIGATSSPD